MDNKNIAGSNIGYTLPCGIYEVFDDNSMLNSLLPNKAKINIENDDIRLKSNSTTNKTIKFTEKSFLHNIRFYSITLRTIK